MEKRATEKFCTLIHTLKLALAEKNMTIYLPKVGIQLYKLASCVLS